MGREEQVREVVDFLQRRITAEFEYPFRVSCEDRLIIFRLCDDRKKIEVKMKQTELIAAVIEGPLEKTEAEINRVYGILRAAAAAENASYENMKESMILRPLNYSYAKNELADVPHFRIGDIALVLYAVMAHSGADYFTAKIYRRQMKDWGKDEKELLVEALANTARKYQPCLFSVEDLLIWNKKNNLMEADIQDGSVSLNKCGYILTNELEINGAVTVFCPGVAEKISRMMDDDFYLAFTSIHEVQVHPARMIEPDVIRASLRDTNKHCNRREDILTDKVYRFNREKKCFGLVENARFRPLAWEMGKAG